MFAPDDTRYPVIRFHFDHIVGFGKWNGPLLQALPNVKELFVIRSEQRIEMRIGNQNHPYRHVKERQEYRFSLQFESLLNFLPKIQELLRISQLYTAESEIELDRHIEQWESAIDFNTTWLVNLSERPKVQVTGMRLTPLVRTPGRIVVTDQRLYFQPLNNVGPNPVDRFDLSLIDRMITRRYVLRPLGLEIFFKDQSSIYLSFKRYGVDQFPEFYPLIAMIHFFPSLLVN